jgi:hypothetical protein
MSTSANPTTSTTQYMLLIYDDEMQWQRMSEAEAGKAFGEYFAYSKALAEAGIIRGGAPLHPTPTATTVRVRDGRTLTTDGPFAETKEQLGGYYILDVASLDEALAWAAKCPGAKLGSVEVRPVMKVDMPEAGAGSPTAETARA